MDTEREMLLLKAAKDQDKAAQEALLQAHMPLIHTLAYRLCAWKRMHEELTQAGIVGFIEAVQRYQAQSGAKLSTYAFPWIVGEMRKTLRLLESQAACSLDDDQKNEAVLRERIGIEGIDLNAIDVHLAVERLERDERLLIFLRYYRDITQNEAARILGKSQSAICKIERRALNCLRDALIVDMET